MFRTLLTTTALAAILTAGAIAQDTTQAPATNAPATTTEAPAAGATTTAPAAVDSSILASGYTVTDKDNLATEIIGKQVYSSTAADAEHIGDVNNLVVGANGEIAAVIIGVGGFLGIGEKNVAVNYSELQWVTADDGSKRFVLPTSKDALESAPDFKTTDEAEAAPSDNNAMAPANQPADAAAPATQTAAPADQNHAAAATPIARDQLTDAPLTAEELIGTNAYGPGDEHLGTIGDVILGQDGKMVDAVVIDFGGFLGIGTKPVAVAIENLRFATDANGNKYLFVNVTRDQLDKAVAYNKDTFVNERDTQLLATQPLK
ncbi:MAG: PRC-barrel domain-containing protein [Devosia sp.]|uniref:PRC-barrel domain-containing protein n=1 Tax=Devosia sp. TaxID=1871048 RepID=UPI001AD439B8|nr:PRC-barrel domain-containing protein [Devosia sp.]MBN9315355.1 PRC-barrel domain-containing protein [Devosia sp.]